MTFSFPPHRLSSDDDALDQQLNDWVAGTDAESGSNTGADALEFHRWASSALGSDLAASGPAAGTWNRVLRNSVQASPKGKREMSTAALSSQAVGYAEAPRESVGQSIRRYSNLVATIALVLAVAVGGWLAMSQLPPGGEGRFAAFQGTPEAAQSQKCDVEPLTVDEVMAIVENPYSTLDPSWWGTPVPGDEIDEANQIQNRELAESPIISIPYPGSGAFLAVPGEEDFSEASAFMETVLRCQQYGTIGQMWALQSPVVIQRDILSRFEVYRDRSEIRSHVESLIDQPYPDVHSEVYLDIQLSANQRMGDARIWVGESPFDLDHTKALFIGVQAVDSNGNTIVTENFEGTAVDGNLESGNGVAYILVYSEASGQWHYYGPYAPRG